MYGKCECFVMQMFVSCVHPMAVLNAACFNAGRGWKRHAPKPVL